MPININGQLPFSPNGFQYKRSLSNSSPEFNGLETFTWNPAYHGFCGDLLVKQITYRVAQFTEIPSDFVSAEVSVAYQTSYPLYGNHVFPMPLTINDALQTPAQSVPAVNLTAGGNVLGVAQQFRYTPVGSTTEITVKNFPQNTPIATGSLIYVDVCTDPQAVYEVQSNSPFGYGPGYSAGTNFSVSGLNYYLAPVDVTTVGNVQQVAFVMGDLTGPTAGSKQYIFSNFASNQNSSITSANEKNALPDSPVLAMGLTQGVMDNSFTLPNQSAKPNLIYDVKITNSIFTNGYASVGMYPYNPAASA